MATTQADVLRLMISEAAFIAGSKRKQLGFDESTKRAMLHASASDVIAWQVSDDSLQCVLAGTQTLAGLKTFTLGLIVGTSSGGKFGTDGGGVFLRSLDADPLDIETNAGDIVFKPADTAIATMDSSSLTMSTGKEIVTAASATGNAGLNVPHGTAPTLPVNGDVWTTTTGYFARINGVTVQLSDAVGVVLIAGAQNVTGLKTFDAGIEIGSSSEAGLTNTAGTTTLKANTTGDDLSLETDSGDLIFKPFGSTVATVDAGGLTMAAGTTVQGNLDIGDNGLATLTESTGIVTFACTGPAADDFLSISNANSYIEMKPFGSNVAQFNASGLQMVNNAGLITEDSSTSLSPFTIPHGVTPTSPANGDMWTTTLGLYVRINGSTVGPLS